MKIKDILTDNGLPNWDVIKTINQFGDMKSTQQPELWHREGNVWEHTKLVVEQIINILDNGAPFINDYTYESTLKYDINRTALIVAALCHDLGKVTTTKWDDGTKEWKTKNHGAEGERITRKLFFDEPDIYLREKICWLVRQHMALHHIFDVDSKVYERMLRLYFDRGNLLELCYLNYADSMGSINDENKDGDSFVNDRLVRVLTTDFSDSITHADLDRHYYGAIKTSSEDSPTIYVLLGVAGSGKSTWAQTEHPDLPVVSRDSIRIELGYAKEGEKVRLSKQEESRVSDVFMGKCNKYLIHGQDFIIDNLNLTKRYRDAYHKEFLRFAPRYEYVYVEAPTIEDNLERRKGQIPKSEIYRMLDNMEFPDPHEYNSLTLIKQTAEEK